MHLLPVFTALALAASLPATAADPKASTTPSPPTASANQEMASRLPVRLYADACVGNLGDAAALAQLMDKIGTPQPADSSFLQGQPGKVWLVTDPFDNTHALARQDRGLCLLYVRQGDAAVIGDEFSRLGEAAPATLKRLQDRRTDDNQRHVLQYTWYEPGKPQAVLLMLTVDPAPAASLRAVLSASYIDAPAN